MVNLQNIQVKVNNSFQTVCPFPIGFVYSSMNSTSTASIFDGSWTEIKGRFPYFNAGTGTGGSNTHTHGLSNGCAQIAIGSGSIGINEKQASSFTVNQHLLGLVAGASWSTSEAAALSGNTDSANNMPAYQTLYAWYRTA